MTDNEMLDAMRDLLMPINLKLEKMDNRINILENRIANIELEMSSIKLEMNRGFRKNNDEIQTLVAVLEAKNILPIAK
ncbi:hypothetical protein D7X87_22225 [bacterium D16-54]|nr:hypothetical protein D7X87_22225 [bacterium D16-54]RKJ10856.1 hypothetical protein D7X65_22440 [bacterium D16-56]